MERIKEALERARQERDNAPPATRLETPRAAARATEISYTQTRTTQVPVSQLRNQLVVSALPEGVFTDAYKILRTQVLQRLRENAWNVLAVTSPGEDEGKTLTAINLAISLAMEVSYSVLLVDANLRHPNVHEHLGLPASQGLSEYLLDDVPLPELLVHPENLDHVVILPGGRAVQNSAELLNSPKMVQLVEELKNRYPSRIVIFDLPPLLSAADTLSFSPYVDAALLVLEDGKTTQDDARRALELLECTNVIGTVLNKAGRD
ncbi:MAG: CpsD/CapB family tyrosine-protein kinase [Gammaproteobacteria bacterium]